MHELRLRNPRLPLLRRPGQPAAPLTLQYVPQPQAHPHHHPHRHHPPPHPLTRDLQQAPDSQRNFPEPFDEVCGQSAIGAAPYTYVYGVYGWVAGGDGVLVLGGVGGGSAGV